MPSRTSPAAASPASHLSSAASAPQPQKSSIRSILTASAIIRIVIGWGAYAALVPARSLLGDSLPTPILFTILTAIVAIIIVCAFGVVTQAEHLAHRLGDPYGTLVLTLSIVLIEVILISAVMLGPGEHATIARDSVMAVSMIVLNLVIGAALLIGGTRHSNLRPNRAGSSAYLALLVVLLAVAFALSATIGENGAFTSAQEIPIIIGTVVLYAYFLFRQMGAQKTDFQEVDLVAASQHAVGTGERFSVREVISVHRAEVILRAVVLVVTVVPIVLLSHDMAALLDIGLGRLGAPVALSGILIAMIVFLPETITTIRAALAGEIQRVSNLCHGALVSTVGLTIPAVLTIGMLTGQTVVLAETPADLALLGITLLLTAVTFGSPKVTAMHGSAHLMVFLVYGLTVFA